MSRTQIMQWLLRLTTKVLCEGRKENLLLPHGSSVDTKHGISKHNAYKQIFSMHFCGRHTMPEY